MQATVEELAKEIALPPFGVEDFDERADPSIIIEKAEWFLKANHGNLFPPDASFHCPQLQKTVEGNEVEKDGFPIPRTEFPHEQLKKQESEILKGIPVKDVCVDGPDVKIHTVYYKDETDGPSKVPLVMVHGLGGSILSFHQNYEELSKDREVYGIDLPGFGLSSRKAKFPSCDIKISDKAKCSEMVEKCEERVIELIENWREEMKLDEMILLGHSFGGYIAGIYAMKHRKRVRHLVLIDPWGMLTEEECKAIDGESPLKKNNFAFRLAMRLSKPCRLNPFDITRAGGHTIGVLIMQVAIRKSQQEAYGDQTMKYFVAVNSQDPTGERLFCILSGYSYMFPILSLTSRFQEQQDYPSMTFIYGKNPSFSSLGGKILQENMTRITVEEVDGASHHVHMEKTTEFHKLMMEVFRKADAEKDIDVSE